VVAVTPIPHLAQPAPAQDLAVSRLSMGFDGGSPILQDLTFKVARGEAVALIGANGSGKTTLLRLCLGLLAPQRGKVELLGEEVGVLSRFALRTLRARVGLIWQRHNLVPRLNVLTNVIHGALGRHPSPALWRHWTAPHAVREEALHCLDRVGLAGLAARRAAELSGGESQRVAIARALMQRPRLILADEPVASLDPQVAEEVMRLFLGLIRNEGITLLYTSHNMDDALVFSDRVLALREGRLSLDAAAPALDKSRLRCVYS